MLGDTAILKGLRWQKSPLSKCLLAEKTGDHKSSRTPTSNSQGGRVVKIGNGHLGQPTFWQIEVLANAAIRDSTNSVFSRRTLEHSAKECSNFHGSCRSGVSTQDFFTPQIASWASKVEFSRSKTLFVKIPSFFDNSFILYPSGENRPR